MRNGEYRYAFKKWSRNKAIAVFHWQIRSLFNKRATKFSYSSDSRVARDKRVKGAISNAEICPVYAFTSIIYLKRTSSCTKFLQQKDEDTFYPPGMRN